MLQRVIRPDTVLVKATVAINLLGNVMGASLTFLYFGLLEPRLKYGSSVALLPQRAGFFLVVMALVMALVIPVNASWVVPLQREVRRKLRGNGGNNSLSEPIEELRALAGRLISMPAKLATATLAGWLLGAAVFAGAPHVIPELFPWSARVSQKIAAWTAFIGAPLTVAWIYFLQERWLRRTIPTFFPLPVLETIPPSLRVNLLPKVLSVSLAMTCLPLVLVSYVSLHHIEQIQAGRQSIEHFVAHMPTLLWFLLVVFLVVGAGLSVFLARSVSEPLKALESGMARAAGGDLDTSVPVVSNDEMGAAAEGFNRMMRAQRDLEMIKDTFGTYLSKDVVEEILKSPGGIELGGEVRRITVLVADLRGFTAISESLRPEQVLKIINRFLAAMTDVILKHKGTIDEFTGDGILVFFGAPRPAQDHCLMAAMCAIEMQESLNKLNEINREDGLPMLSMGIGINSGELVVGNIGCEKRKKYGAVGAAINVAFRIQALSKGGVILVSEEVAGGVRDKVHLGPGTRMALKGFETPFTVYEVLRVASGKAAS
jgi:sigma-B regulation protein RsbU (phosphoserine phosphatase)